MKKALLIIGILLIAAAALSLLLAAFYRFGYYHTHDGSQELYSKLMHRMKLFFIVGLALAGLGAACFFIRMLI